MFSRRVEPGMQLLPLYRQLPAQRGTFTRSQARIIQERCEQPEPQEPDFSIFAEGVTARPPLEVQRNSDGIARPTAYTASIVSSSGMGL